MGHQVLLIDDNRDDRLLVERELQREFAELSCSPVVDGAEFESALGNGGFQMVITDYQLRWTTGLEVLRTVKKRLPDLPVVMFTGTGNEEIAVEAMKTGLDEYVVKRRGSYARLAVTVRSVLERAHYRKKITQLEASLRSAIHDLKAAESITLDKVLELEQIADAIVGRELRMAQVEAENEQLKAELRHLRSCLR
jgi:DNA-binding NtrC family response regulator